MSNDNINYYAAFISKQLNEGNGDSKEGNYVSFFDMVGPDEVNTLHGLMKKHGFEHGKDYKVHTAMGDTDPHGMTIHNNEIFKHPDIKSHVRDDMMGPGSEKGNRTDSKMKRAFNTEEVEQIDELTDQEKFEIHMTNAKNAPEGSRERQMHMDKAAVVGKRIYQNNPNAKRPSSVNNFIGGNTIEAFAQFISKQLVGEGVETLSESLAKATKAIEKMDGDAIHVGSHGTQHVFIRGGDHSESHHYTVHDTATGKNHDIHLEHGGKAMTMAQIKKAADKDKDDVQKLMKKN